jgi:Tfp pilus assembly major pilin PilA
MRSVLFITSLFFLFSCAKQRMVNRLEGRWRYTKMLMNNGEYVNHSEVYEFTGGDKDEKSGLPFIIYGQDTTQWMYQTPKKSVIKVTNASTNKEIDWLIEDMDNNSLIFRVAEGVVFLDKE